MTTVVVSGCLQIIHPGHCRLLAKCKELAHGGVVIVALNTDESVERLKPGRLYVPYAERRHVLESIRFVDIVHPFNTEDELISLIKLVRPGYLVKGKGKCSQEKIDLLASWGGQYISMEADGDESTTELVRRLRA